MGQLGSSNSSKAPGSAAVTIEQVWPVASGDGYGFTTDRSQAAGAFTASGDGYGVTLGTTTHAIRVRKRGSAVFLNE